MVCYSLPAGQACAGCAGLRSRSLGRRYRRLPALNGDSREAAMAYKLASPVIFNSRRMQGIVDITVKARMIQGSWPVEPGFCTKNAQLNALANRGQLC